MRQKLRQNQKTVARHDVGRGRQALDRAPQLAKQFTCPSARTAARSLAVMLGVGTILFSIASSRTARADELQAEKTYAWEFQRSEDRNVDQWPDGWRRRTGRNFPAYIPIRIAPRDPESAQVAREAEPVLSRLWLAFQSGDFLKQFIPESTPEPLAQFMDKYVVNSCLSIDMNGGAVQLESPVFALDPRFTYTLDTSLATQALDGHRAWVEMLLLDSRGSVVASAPTPSVTGSTPWCHFTTGSLTSESLHSGQVVVHVEPLKSSKLTGRISIDEIRLYRMPKLELSIDAPHHVAATNQLVEVTCTVLGVHDARSNVNFTLINHLGEVTDQATAPLTPVRPVGPPPESTGEAEEAQAVMLTTAGGRRPARRSTGITEAQKQALRHADRADGIAHWQLSVPEPGYYRVVVDLGRAAHHSGSRRVSREASLAIIQDSHVGVGGPFGWSLPDFNAILTPEMVPELVKLGGVGWLKIPVWFDPRDVDKAERLSVLLERLDLRKVNCVGILDQPSNPDSSPRAPQPAAIVFSSPESWESQLEPALTRMSMKLTWFQLGRDYDRSFTGNPNLIPLMTDIRNRMQSYAQEMQLALTWDYQDPIPGDKNLPWLASQMSSEPQLTAKELRSELSEPSKTRHTRWITLNPISATRYRTLDRVRDLAERMIAVKEHQVEAAFVTTPMSSETGIFNPDGSVGELFLPWRLLNRKLATATFLGSVNMPGGSTNFVFAEGQTGFMILWNDRTAVEQLYLGDEVVATDLWGKTFPVEETKSDRNTSEQKLLVTSWPVLVHGINLPVANWRMRFQLEKNSLPSTPAQRAELPITVENTLSQSAFGTLSLSSPTLLQSGSPVTQLQMNAGERRSTSVPVPLRNDASAGKHALRFDFQINSDREYAFSAYENLTLGNGDIELQWDALEVTETQATIRVEVTNKTNQPVSFDCKLFPPRQPYRRFQITNAPAGQTVRDIVLPLTAADADSVLWIRCEEIGTGRVLNYRISIDRAGDR